MSLDERHVAQELGHLRGRLGLETVQWAVGASVMLPAGRLVNDGIIVGTDRALHFYKHVYIGSPVHEKLPLTAVEACRPTVHVDGIEEVAPTEPSAPWAIAVANQDQLAFLAAKLHGEAPPSAPPPLPVAATGGPRRPSRKQALVAAAVAAVVVLVAGVALASSGGPESPQDVLCEDWTSMTVQERDEIRLGAAAELDVDRAKVPDNAMYEACVTNPEGLIGEKVLALGDPEPSVAATPEAVETQAAANAFKPVRTYRWDARAESGSEATVVLELGSVREQDQPLPEGFENLGSVCDSDSQRDAFLPVRMTVRNTTDDFDLAPSLRLTLHNVNDRFQARVGAQAADAFNDGPSCRALTAGSIDDGVGIDFGDVAPGDEDDHNTLLVLSNYYTPETPAGDDAALQEWFAALLLREDAGPLKTVCFDAPAGRYAFAGGILRLVDVLSPGVPLGNAPVERTKRTGNEPYRCIDSAPENIEAESGVPDAPCLEVALDSEMTTSKGPLGQHRVTYNRAGSLHLVCTGFGAPEGLEFSTGMECALIAAAATYAPLPEETTAKVACKTAEVQEALEAGSWAGPATGAACDFFGEALAGAAGIIAAGATAPTGPGAAAVGLTTYKAFSAGMELVCGGLFEGGAENLGEWLESGHERRVAMDILHDGKCLRQADQEANIATPLRWSAAKCPD